VRNDLIAWREELIRCAQTGTAPLRPAHPFQKQPVLIVAGTCREETGREWDRFINRLESRLADFSGRVISGGTRAGVCREVGRISSEIPKGKRNWTSVGYLPRSTSPDLIDNRYDELVFTAGSDFSEIEPLQYWTDILASDISPEQIFFFRHGGGELSRLEEELFNEMT